MEKKITLTVGGTPLQFLVTTAAHDQYINEMAMDNKVAPARNYLFRTVCADSREALKGVLEHPGAAIQLAAVLLKEFSPDLEVLVEK